MNKGDLFPRNSLSHQLLTDIVIDIEVPDAGFFRSIRQRSRFLIVRGFPARSGQIAENELGQFFRVPVTPDADNIAHAGIDLASGIIRQ